MNAASASDYIRNFKQMMLGKPYHRTLNAYSTELYLNGIRHDHGDAFARNALYAVRAHIVYYQGISGARSPGITALCDRFETELGSETLAENQRAFEAAVEASELLSPDDRTAAIAKWPSKPSKKSVTTTAYIRNPHVVAAVLSRAAGKCEACMNGAPFNRKSDGSPYLEVHHKTQLASGGDDTVENAIALCPNCHRRHHYG
jgi:5-methylcytosine-specific restriction protein A